MTAKGMHERSKAYVAHVVCLYESGKDNAFEAFLAAYRGSHERMESEADLEYVQRCAEQDFHDGEQGAAVYQDVYDELCLIA